MDDLMKWLYELLGARYPRLSMGIVMIFGALGGALLFGAAWWSIGQQYRRERTDQEMQNTVNRLQQELDDRAKRAEIRNSLSAFLAEGMKLRDRCSTDPPGSSLEQDAERWFNAAKKYIAEQELLGASYLTQFEVTQPTAFRPGGVPENRLGLWYGINDRVNTLSRFIDQLK